MTELESIITTLDLIARATADTRLRRKVARFGDELRRAHEKRLRIDRVLAAVSSGWDSLDEIVAETGIPRNSAIRYLHHLARAGKVRIRTTLTEKKRRRHCFTAI